jgi:hypothetical protein
MKLLHDKSLTQRLGSNDSGTSTDIPAEDYPGTVN